MKTIQVGRREKSKECPDFGFLTRHCAFCGIGIKPNFWNACWDCKKDADREPEFFINKFLTV